MWLQPSVKQVHLLYGLVKLLHETLSPRRLKKWPFLSTTPLVASST